VPEKKVSPRCHQSLSDRLYYWDECRRITTVPSYWRRRRAADVSEGGVQVAGDIHEFEICECQC
jgi:hypothetical protein